MIWPFVLINVAFALLYAPLVDGIERKVKARVQCRKGPPIMQTWYDLMKLFRREALAPEEAQRTLFSLGPALAFSAVLATFFLVPTIFPQSLSFYGDVIAVIYLVTLASFSIIIGAFSSANPYAQLGANREASILFVEELMLAFIIGAFAFTCRTLTLQGLFPLRPKVSIGIAYAMFVFITYVTSARVPFDIPEAEPEIAEGPYIEYSGKMLGIAKYSLYLKRILFVSMMLDFVLPKVMWEHVLGYLIGIVVIPIIFACVEAYYGRMRVDQAVSLMKRLSLVTIASWIIAALGW